MTECERIGVLFGDLFFKRYETLLLPHDDDPVYIPGSPNRIMFRKGTLSSALHEAAHWCLAGRKRRQLLDYGYWYLPDGRTPAQQRQFEQVEIRPQALEWYFSVAARHPFHFSADNLNGGMGPSRHFKQAVERELAILVGGKLPQRARLFARALASHEGVSGPADATGAVLRTKI